MFSNLKASSCYLKTTLNPSNPDTGSLTAALKPIKNHAAQTGKKSTKSNKTRFFKAEK